MKISFLQYYDSPFGSSRRTFEYAQEFIKRGHEVTYVTNNYSHISKINEHKIGLKLWMRVTISGVKVYYINSIPYSGNGIGRLVSAFYTTLIFTIIEVLIIKSKYVVYSNVPLISGISLFLIKILYKSKKCLILELRDLWPDCFLDTGVMERGSIKYRILKILERISYQSADGIVSTVKDGHKYVSRSIKHNHRIIHIPNGIRLLENCFRDVHLQNFIMRKSEKICRIIYVGSFGIDHDVMTIVKTAARLENLFPNRFEFHMYGDGVRYDEVRTYLKQSAVKSVKLNGILLPSVVGRIQSSATLLISAVSDLISYSCGLNSNKIASYLVCGPPVVLAAPTTSNPIYEIDPKFQVQCGTPDSLANVILMASEMTVIEYMEYRKNVDAYIQNTLNIERLALKYEEYLGELH